MLEHTNIKDLKYLGKYTTYIFITAGGRSG